MNDMQKQAAVSTAKTVGAVIAILIGCAAVVGGLAMIGRTFGTWYAVAIMVVALIAFIVWCVYQDHMWHARNKDVIDSCDRLVYQLSKYADELADRKGTRK